MASKPEVNDIEYLVETVDGLFKMTLPAHYRLTLGPLAPGSKYQNGIEKLVLRVYDGTKQRAIFMNVERFMDTRIQISHGVKQPNGDFVWEIQPIIAITPVVDPDKTFKEMF